MGKVFIVLPWPPNSSELSSSEHLFNFHFIEPSLYILQQVRVLLLTSCHQVLEGISNVAMSLSDLVTAILKTHE